MATPKLDWPSLDEAYYPEQHAEPPASSSPQGKSKPPSGSPHTPGGPRSGSSPGSGGGGVNEAQGDTRERTRREAAERLSARPQVLAAVSKLVAACGQMCASVQRPFLTVCDAAMGVSVHAFPGRCVLMACGNQYHLPACLRLLEAAHIPEILREAGPRGLHVEEIARRVGEVRRGRSVSSGCSQAPGEGSSSEGAGDIRPDEDTGGSHKGGQRAGSPADGQFGLDPSLLSAYPRFSLLLGSS